MKEDARAYITQHLELVGLVVLVVATFFLPKSVPLGVYGLGVVGGASFALQAVGLVVVYRANRVINFAQVEVGALGGLLFVELARRQTFLVGLHYLCPSCMAIQGRRSFNAHYSVPVHPAGWLVGTNYWLAILTALLGVVFLSWLAHVLVIRRFIEAPRLILTVVTIGLAQVYVLGQGLLAKAFGDASGASGAAPLPFHLKVHLSAVTFGASDVITVIVAVVAVAGLVAFLRLSSVGVILRGAAENPRRAETLGADVRSVTSIAWIMAGVLSAAAAILAGTSLGVTTAGDPGTLVRILAAAVIGGMVSLPLTILAAVVIGILDQSVLWAISSRQIVDGLLVLVIVGVLLLQRSRASRADTDAEGGWRATKESRPIPRELWRLEVVRRWVRYGQAALAVVLLSLPWILSPGQTSLATDAVLDAVLGLSLLVLTGWAGQISLGQFGLAAVGAWVVAASGLPFALALPLAALAGAAAAVVIGLPALRLRGLNLAITTLAFALSVNAVLLDKRYLGKELPASIGRPAFLGLGLQDERTFYYFVLAFLAVAVAAVVGLRRSRTARALIACRDNEILAQAYGINLLRTRLSAFAISGVLAAVAGALFAYTQFGVQAQNFSVGASISIFLIAVIGGLGSIAGPLIGAAYYGVVTIFSTNALAAVAATGVGVVVILVMLPGGLGDGLYRVRDMLLRRVADRYRIEVPSLVADRRRGLGDRASIAPNKGPDGGRAFVPRRYRVESQWALQQRERQPAKATHG